MSPVLKYRDPVSGLWVALPATAWPPNEVVSQVNGAGGASTTSLAYVDWPPSGYGGPLQATLNKRMNSTLVVVSLTVSSWHSSGAQVNYAVSIDGAAATSVIQCYYNTASDHRGWASSRAFSGLSAGPHTFKAQVKITSGTLSCDGNDTFSMSVREVSA